jgi:hypothetical protein
MPSTMALGRWAALPCIGVEPGYAACAIVIAFGTMPVANLTNIALSAELTAGLALKAPIADPTFTGTVTIPTLAVGTAATVPTATVGDSDTTAASTAFVMTGGALTLNAAGETPELVRNAANDAWLVLRLNGATIV